MWEPRIEVNNVTASIGQHERGSILIDIDYSVKVINDERSLVYPFYTIPERE